jgi:hypothetical protein
MNKIKIKKTPKTHHKKRLVEWLKVYAVNFKPRTAKKHNKQKTNALVSDLSNQEDVLRMNQQVEVAEGAGFSRKTRRSDLVILFKLPLTTIIFDETPGHLVAWSS